MKDNILAAAIVSRLNSLLAADKTGHARETLTFLLGIRVERPSVASGTPVQVLPGSGLLDVLNGMVGPIPEGPKVGSARIFVEYEGDVVSRFSLVENRIKLFR
jgi:hypothetical protein